jgi:SAM-dependent methyltransferase
MAAVCGAATMKDFAETTMSSDQMTPGLLGDSQQTSYGDKLNLFNYFAAPEIRNLLCELGLKDGDVVLDAGCGTGVVTSWLLSRVLPTGHVIGLDLAAPHVREAMQHRHQVAQLCYVQADMSSPPFQAPFDLIWCTNAINHLRRRQEGVRALASILRPGGRLVLGQSAFLPDMMFAWDYRFEKEVRSACLRYYHDKYNLDESDTTADRNLFGLLQQAGLRRVTAKTVVIERTAPLTREDERYFVEGVFKAYWGHRLRPYLAAKDWDYLEQLCDPDSPQFCLRRPDFHHIQTFTICSGFA